MFCIQFVRIMALLVLCICVSSACLHILNWITLITKPIPSSCEYAIFVSVWNGLCDIFGIPLFAILIVHKELQPFVEISNSMYYALSLPGIFMFYLQASKKECAKEQSVFVPIILDTCSVCICMSMLVLYFCHIRHLPRQPPSV